MKYVFKSKLLHFIMKMLLNNKIFGLGKWVLPCILQWSVEGSLSSVLAEVRTQMADKVVYFRQNAAKNWKKIIFTICKSVWTSCTKISLFVVLWFIWGKHVRQPSICTSQWMLIARLSYDLMMSLFLLSVVAITGTYFFECRVKHPKSL